MTAEELLRFPNPYVRKYSELVRGVMEVHEPSSFDPSAVASRIMTTVGSYVFSHELGEVTGEAGGYILARNPDTVRAPDIAFVRRERLSEENLTPGFFAGAPDLAIEVISPSDNRKRLLAKVEEYLAAGTSLVWVFDMWARTVTVYRPSEPPFVVRDGGSVDGGAVIPGFRLELATIWRGQR